jgi:hypothetical protein
MQRVGTQLEAGAVLSVIGNGSLNSNQINYPLETSYHSLLGGRSWLRADISRCV